MITFAEVFIWDKSWAFYSVGGWRRSPFIYREKEGFSDKAVFSSDAIYSRR